MIYYEGIPFLKVLMLTESESKEFIICYYKHCLDKGFRFQSNLWNGCHYVLLRSMNLRNIATLNIH